MSDRIPADMISFPDDGRAWWLPKTPTMTTPYGKRFQDPTHLHGLDRPCDTCKGDEIARSGGKRVRVPSRCPDCVDGRHTFDIETDAPDAKGPRQRHPAASSWRQCDQEHDHNVHQMLYDPWVACPGLRKRRVSVIPGQILPIVDQRNTDHDHSPSIELRDDGTFWLYTQEWCDDKGRTNEAGRWEQIIHPTQITLPSSARPRMFAVELLVSS